MEINFLAVFVLSLVPMIIGSFWYGPIFGDKWMKVVGLTKKDIENTPKNEMVKMYGFTYLSGLLRIIFSAMLINALGINTFLDGAILGAGLWFAYSLLVAKPSFLFQKKSKAALFLDFGMYFFDMIIICGVLAVW